MAIPILVDEDAESVQQTPADDLAFSWLKVFMAKYQSEADIRLSKNMARILRHAAVKEGLHLDEFVASYFLLY